MAFNDPGDPGYFSPAPTPGRPQPPAPVKTISPNPLKPSPWLGDPGYLAATTNQKNQIPAIDTMTKSAIARLLVQYGDSGIAGKYDPSVAAEAAANTQSGNSVLARLMHQHDLNQRGVINALAAHGILNSGDTGYRTSEENRAYGNQVSDSQAQLMQLIDQANQSAAQQKQALAQQVVSALENAFSNYSGNPAFYGQAQGK